MYLKEILKKCANLNVFEKRCEQDDYIELVFLNSEIEGWQGIFSELFGTPIKPPGANPTNDDNSVTRKFGGIYNNQTLYKKDFSEVVIMAMFWPWQDGVHTTLKLAMIKK